MRTLSARSAVMVVMLLFLSAALAALAPAAAADTAPSPEPLTYTTTVTQTDYTTSGKVVGTSTRQMDTAVTPYSTGGSSSASGCRKVSVMRQGKTLLGFTAYDFINETYWCWTRSTQVVYNVSTDWWIYDVDPNYYWKGIVSDIHGFYDYGVNDGHPHSAYKNQRTGEFDNCLVNYCLGAYYPTVLIRSYYNGTYYWDTWG